MLGDFSEGSTSARFHLIGRDKQLRSELQKSVPEQSSHPLGWWGVEGSGERGSYTAAVDGQEQERQWAVVPYQGPESRHIQPKVLWGQR